MASQPFDLSLGLEDIHVLVTGGNGQIGRVVVDAFLAAGSYVTIIDKTEASPHAKHAKLLVLQGDITADLAPLWSKAVSTFGVVQVCVALAALDFSFLPETESICDAEPSAWQRVFNVNIHGTFNTCQTWLRGVRTAAQDPDTASKLKNVSLVIMGSEAGRDGTRTMAAYAAGKAAVQYGLLASLAKDVPRIWPRARVNAVAPGTVDTEVYAEEVRRYGRDFVYANCEATTPLAGPVPVSSVARTILFLASARYSGSVHGQVIHVDNGRMGSLVWSKGESTMQR